MNNQKFNTYPTFENTNSSINQNTNNNMINKLLPLIMSGKPINEILPQLGINTPLNNPLISSILSNTNSQKPNSKTQKIKSDKIDVSSLYKIN